MTMDRTVLEVPDDDEEPVLMFHDDQEYRAVMDPHTADWAVINKADDWPQELYFRSKEGVIQFMLEQAGVIDDGDYKMAPDRC